jgi:hypothetical protein
MTSRHARQHLAGPRVQPRRSIRLGGADKEGSEGDNGSKTEGKEAGEEKLQVVRRSPALFAIAVGLPPRTRSEKRAKPESSMPESTNDPVVKEPPVRRSRRTAASQDPPAKVDPVT